MTYRAFLCFVLYSRESVQGVLLDRRTPSELDMVANTAGACIGLLGVAAWQWWRRRTAD